jgi:predicted TPR repeat methyltransferase
MGLLRKAGAEAAAAELCQDICEQYPEAAWAHRQLGFMLLAAGDAERAVTCFQVRAMPAQLSRCFGSF